MVSNSLPKALNFLWEKIAAWLVIEPTINNIYLPTALKVGTRYLNRYFSTNVWIVRYRYQTIYRYLIYLYTQFYLNAESECFYNLGRQVLTYICPFTIIFIQVCKVCWANLPNLIVYIFQLLDIYNTYYLCRNIIKIYLHRSSIHYYFIYYFN